MIMRRSIVTPLVFLPTLLLLCDARKSVRGIFRVGVAPLAFAAMIPPNNKKALEDVTVDQKNQAGMTKLRFQASTSYATRPATYRPGVAEFFFRDENRDMLLAGSRQNRIEAVQPPNSELYHLWEVEAEAAKNVRPSMEDPILRVTTDGINFPGGLAIRTIATVGCKKVSTKTTYPELQITLICDELEAHGPEPWVWLFNRLTGGGGGGGGGGGNNKKDEGIMMPRLTLLPFFETSPKARRRSERSTHSSNSITAETTENGVVFRSVVRLDIDMSFPTLLLNVLPVSKQMAEKQGSEAILDVVERDIGPSLEALCQRYEKNGTSF